MFFRRFLKIIFAELTANRSLERKPPLIHVTKLRFSSLREITNYSRPRCSWLRLLNFFDFSIEFFIRNCLWIYFEFEFCLCEKPCVRLFVLFVFKEEMNWGKRFVSSLLLYFFVVLTFFEHLYYLLLVEMNDFQFLKIHHVISFLCCLTF